MQRHRPQEVSLSPLCWDFPLRNIVGSQLGQKHSCGGEQEEEDEEGGYEEDEAEEVEEGKEKGWGEEVGNRRRETEAGGGCIGGDLVPLISIPEPLSVSGEVQPAHGTEWEGTSSEELGALAGFPHLGKLGWGLGCLGPVSYPAC